MTEHKWEGKLVVGLGGGAGAGKGKVQTLLTGLGAFTIDADEIAKRVLQQNAPGYRPVVNCFGEGILDQDRKINRVHLNRLVNSNRRARELLDAVLGPLIIQGIASMIHRARQKIVVVMASDLSRFGLVDLFDRVWLILDQPDGFDHSLEADASLYTSDSPDKLLEQVKAAWEGLTEQDTPVQALPVVTESGAGSGAERTPEVPHTVRKEALPESPEEAILPGPKSEITDHPLSGLSLKEVRLIGRRILNIVLTLLVIAYLTSWGLILAERGREHLPAQPLQASWQALVRVGSYLIDHPQTYYWHKDNVAALQVVSVTLKNSAGLLVLALGLALVMGLSLGFVAALAKRKTSSALVMLISVMGISTPSFLVGMFLWVINIWVHKTFDIKVLPASGFGWDFHLIMPAIVLAMRPLAQIAQVTYVTMHDVLGQDYIRTAHSKGLSWRLVRNVHVLPNILIPILTTLGSSLRYSLASLPVVEVFFDWPGVGSMLLDAIQQGNDALVTDLILSLGLFFLFVNLVIEFTFPLIDPRLRDETDTEEMNDQKTLRGWMREVGNTVLAWARDLRQRFAGQTSELPPLPTGLNLLPVDKERPGVERHRWLLRNYLSNPAFILGSVMMIALFGFVLFGERLSAISPYQIHGVLMIDGKIGAPPYEPSATFPWGTDHLGRDIQALVLAGGKRTLTLAFFGMLARLLLGALLGILAGWQRGGWFDRLVSGGVGVWAAFPVTLFAMILIQALGIQQGMWVFIVAISVVGWGEVAQFVRGQVISLKPQLFIESARSVGSRPDQILVRHIFPNLVNSLIVLAALEMGGVLMLLAELGYLNIFMGGGFRAMIAEVGAMVPVIASYSDVPEWAALIANVREYWRSYPWMALYPGLAVFLSIMTFNLFGEGLRRFLEDTYSNLSRLFNRYTFFASLGLVVVVVLVLQSSVPINVYRPEGLKFDEQRVMQDIENLSSFKMQGRETGTSGATMAAIYIAYRMSEIGIFPAGESHTYLQHLVQPRDHLFEMPTLAILDKAGKPTGQLKYKQDFTEIGRFGSSVGDAQAPVMGVAFGPIQDPSLSDEYGLSNSAAMDHIVIVQAEDMEKVNTQPVKGVLAIADETYTLDRRDLKPYRLAPREQFRPFMLISPEVADNLLKTAGSSLAELNASRDSLKAGQMKLTGEGTQVSMSLQPRRADNFLDENYINVIGVIPGQGHFMGTEEQVIIVSAYYDGLGTDLNGTVYPGANDNASGVATMLELARLMKESAYQPDKTVLFVAWAGGERQEGLSVVNVLNARPGASGFNVETVIELSGVGYGIGDSINLGNDSSYRLVKLFQKAASRYNLATTTRGRNPHYGLPLPTAFGGRDAMTLSISWDGSDSLAHTPRDTIDIIDPEKLFDIGRTTYLTLLVLSRETDY